LGNKRSGLVARTAWEVGVSIREYRELELRDVGPDLQAVRLAAIVPLNLVPWLQVRMPLS
jgi:hypothetical protein